MLEMGLLGMPGNLPPLLLILGLLMGKVTCSCDIAAECNVISVLATTSQIGVTGLPVGFVLQNATYLNETLATTPAQVSNTSIVNATSGTQYIIHYGNSSISCCQTITTQPKPVKLLQTNNVTSNSVPLSWDKPDEYNSYYTYRVQTNTSVSSSIIVTKESATISSLTAGETYTFSVFTRADNVTEGESLSVTTCTVPGKSQNITVSNKNSISFLEVTWTRPAGKVDYYNVSLTGDINTKKQTDSTQVNFTDLLPGREYSIIILTVSANCSQPADPVIEATYPSQPGPLNVTNTGTNSISFSWGDPLNMTGVFKTFNITYRNSSGVIWSLSRNTSSVTLQSLRSGTNYTITVVTIGVRQYQSLPVSNTVITKPKPVKLLGSRNVTSNSVPLSWDKPDEYNSYYTYRVQTNTSVSSSIIVTNESVTISNLTAGETYTFSVFTRADNVTEGESVSVTTCTVPGKSQNITVSNKNSISFLEVSWTRPAGKVDYYNVTLTGDINTTKQTDSTQVNFTDLLPGREYSIIILTVSGNCSQPADPVIEATYPSQPGPLNVTNTGTNSISFSWGDPLNMTGVVKTFNITYRNSSGATWSLSSNTASVTLQSLRSGSNYTITVVTVGVRQYQSLPVSNTVTTKPKPVKLLRSRNVTSNSVPLSWDKPDEYNSYYTYRVQTNTSVSSSIIVTNESVTISNLTAGETYTFSVFTRADNVTEGESLSVTTCTVPGKSQNITVSNKNSISFLEVTWTRPAGKVDYYNVSLTGDINITKQTDSTQVNFTDLLPGREYSIIILTVSGNCSQPADPVIEATYPSQPGPLNVTNTGTNSISFSWGDPLNMTGVVKTFNITYRNSSGVTWSISSNTASVTLQSLRSGTNYTITVVTIGVRPYQSLPVSNTVTTKPKQVTKLQTRNVTSNVISMIWDKPDEYNSYYTYRVQTNTSVSSSSIIVTNESATISSLTAGETYTFSVFTRADNVTEGESLSVTTCAVPGLLASQNITVNNKNSTSFLEVNWTKPAGKVDSYKVILTGAINITKQTDSTHVNFTDLLPGREYSIIILTVSGNCSQPSAPLVEATYPSKPGNLTFTNNGTNSISLSWGDPINMSNVTKTFNITYRSSSGAWSVSSNTASVTLQSLRSGTKYTITVVTVGARQYQSLPVSSDETTGPYPVKNLRADNVTSNSVPLSWDKPEEYNSNYTYRVQTNTSSPSSAVVVNESVTAVNNLTISNLTPGETYIFTVFARADNVTEGDSVSLTTCTVPGKIPPSNIIVNNKNSISFLEVNWTKPAGKVDYYNVTLTGDLNITKKADSTQVNFTDLLPGRDYSIIILTVSANCSQPADPVIEATYPSKPGNLNFTNIGTNSISLSWGDPINMSNVTKTFNITYRSSSGTWSVSSNTASVTLQSLRSGTKYTITAVTVGVRQYQSLPVSNTVTTKPKPVTQLRANDVTSNSVPLSWDKPDEYNSYYTYRVQTNTSVSSSIIVTKESATISSLTAGETYTFSVFTRADNVTEGESLSVTTCTVPGKSQNITVSNKNSISFLEVTWTRPAGKVDYYNVSLTGDINITKQTDSTQVNFTDLLPGREYSIIILTVSGNCSQPTDPVIEATYPSQPGPLNVTNTGTNSISFSWGDPLNMTGVIKSFNITYRNSSGATWSISSNTSSVTLQSLRSGTNYTITVVTVGVRQYQSLPVSNTVTTKPKPVTKLQTRNVTSNVISMIWDKPDEYNSYYTYRVQTNTSVSSSSIIVTNESATISNLTAGETYIFSVFTRADNVTEGESLSVTTCAVPGLLASQNITVNNKNSISFLEVNWTKPAGKVDSYKVSLTGAINITKQTDSTQVNFTDLLPGREYSIIIQTVSGNCSQPSAPLVEATYPSKPGNLTFTNTGTHSISLTWGDPLNMSNVTKTFNITYRSSSGAWSVSSNTASVTLQTLRSGTKYTITVVTVGARQYQSLPVSGDVYTRPYPVKNLRADNVTSNSVPLSWDKFDEYNSNYTYRVQTNTSSPSSAVVVNESVTAVNNLTISNLTPGETYIFTVFARADNVTEGDSVSLTTCTVPGKIPPSNITVNNKNSISFLEVNWTKPAGKVDYYNVTLTGDLNITKKADSTQVNFTDLLPGREYSIIILTVSANCSQPAEPVIEATYPSKPGDLIFTNIGTNIISLSWGDPINMINVAKTFNITYRNSSGAWSVSSNTASVTLQSLRSGTKYTITAVTVGVRQYQSLPVSGDVYTKPKPVKLLRANDVTSNSVPLSWDKPDEYNSYYTYRVQTNTSVSSSIIVTNESVTISNLTAGETYTFSVFTRADNVTEGESLSVTTCTVPGLLTSENITVSNKNSISFLEVNWTKPAGKVDYYNVTLTGDINTKKQTDSTQVNFTDLLPGREYSINILTVSGNCSQPADPVIEATYPSKPRDLVFNDIGTNNMSLSWGDPITMTSVTKTFNITYSNSSGAWSISSNTASVTLQSLMPGTKYSITVATVGARQYQSLPVSSDETTVPDSVPSFECYSQPEKSALSFTWQCPNGQHSFFKLTVTDKTPVTNVTTVVSNCSSGYQSFNVTHLKYHTEYAVNITTLSYGKESNAVQEISCWTSITSPPDPPVTVVQNPAASSHNVIDFTFLEFDNTNGPIKAYAVIITTDTNGQKPPSGILSKTYKDFKSKNTKTYVTYIKASAPPTGRSNKANPIAIRVGDGSSTHGYNNGPLEPLTAYRISVAGFTAIEYDNSTGVIMEDRSLSTTSPYSDVINTPQDKGVIAGAVVGCILGSGAIGIMGFFIWRRRRQGGKKNTGNNDISIKKIKSHAIKTEHFESHFRRQQANTNLGFSEEYESFASVGVTQSKATAEIPENKEKNRYSNVLPYDISRVKLSIQNNPTDDYINANYIPGYKSKREFIAAQGPLPLTVQDYWRMVWEKNICAIVMLTRCVETGKVKCEEYWSTKYSNNRGGISVSVASESVFPDWTIRDFTVRNTRTHESHPVRQFHFTAWPDHGVPKTTDVLISFRNLMCEYTNENSSNSPTLVHCSAGVGRTGTLIALDRIMNQIEAEDTVDVYGAVYDLRMHRALMVQTESQYVFLNQCALDVVKARREKPDLVYQNSGAMGIYENILPPPPTCKSQV
ncbi:receptor-type tyrosine-protein phosphatase beta-like isoform X1 [Ascaphus truei]|uniref:receptor-type tyrosine-protein phosphatase beta-like isoform X1 n=1 Tax=Ascaphus truei TaxID=8439 RepID=UPI003F5A11B7